MLKHTLASLCLAGLLSGCGSVPEGPASSAAAAAPAAAKQEQLRPRAAVNHGTPLGINFDAQKDYSVQQTFVDCIKTSRQWETNGAPTPVDAHGWPTGDFSVQVFAGLPQGHGTYSLSCEGRCRITGAGSGPVTVSNVSFDGTTTRAQVTLGPTTHPSGLSLLRLNFTQTSGGVKNLKVIRPGYPADTTQVFTDLFLDKLEPFTVIRDVHWSQVIRTTVSRWEQRPRFEDAQQSSPKGVCYEYLIDLANESGKDLWICLPDQADDEFVRQLGHLLKERLHPDRKVWIELSDEIWNPEYPATHRYLAAAQQEVGPLNSYGQETDRFSLMYRLVARRTIQISDILATVFPGEMLTRIRPVMPGQFGDTYHMANALAWAQEQYGALNARLYGLTSAPYFTLSPADNVRTDLTADEILARLDARLTEVTARFGVDPSWNGRWDWRTPPTYHTMANFYNLQNTAYEAGPDTMGAESLAAKKQANLDPRMAAMVERELREWYRQGNGMLVYYDFAATMNEFGQAGLYQDLSVETPKSQAVLRVINDLLQGQL